MPRLETAASDSAAYGGGMRGEDLFRFDGIERDFGFQAATADNLAALTTDQIDHFNAAGYLLSLIHISEPTRQEAISYAVFCLKKK